MAMPNTSSAPLGLRHRWTPMAMRPSSAFGSRCLLVMGLWWHLLPTPTPGRHRVVYSK